MKIFISGADGFVGSNLVRELLNRSHEVVAFVKEGDDPMTIKHLDIDIQYGDLLDTASITKAMKGCDAVVHTAANTAIWPYRSEIQNKINIGGTINMVDAAKTHGVLRFIHVGTANSFGFGSKAKPGDETRPYSSDIYGMDYMDSKYKAHQYILEEVRKNKFPAVVINPTFMFGPYPARLGSAKMIVSVYQKKVPGYTRGGRNYIAVKDVCVGIANALTMGTIGESYIVGHKNLSYKEVFTLIAQVVGVEPPKLAIPSFAAKSFGFVNTIAAKLTKQEPSVSYAMAQMSVDEHYYSARKAIEAIQLPQTPLETAIKESFDWLKEHNYI
jgi:dihydroflavonol-4-reductase